ncbi:hypothetical protein C7H19_08800 [Aphanothece hegewaldii CCALA 016]|uniref:Uncharacterized protein n=1 Tax=Aphanothece hegewaldii CCALA 016 TaxID=2107694 RepID=A0A2T1LZ27_9CHRO|nr:hypothetical protein [Aphanothece hegewaldii]PSF37643.1 hypothetical protein C7H19_08800 [Aphanothece hegewaldii CCALA 016]
MIFSKFRWSMLVGIVCTISFICYAVTSFSQSPQASVQLVTDPPLSQVIPLEAEATEYLGSGKYESPVQLRFQALDAKGKPLQNARYRLQILTPPPTPWFTTDFPIVEGTKLLDISGDAPTGELQIQQVFPIRGNYQLQASVTPIVENAFTPIEQTLTLTIPENPLKWRYFPIVLGILLAIGFVGGWVIGDHQKSQYGEIAPRRVRMLLSGVTVSAIVVLFFFNISAELAQAQMDGMTAETTLTDNGLIQSQGMKLELTGDSNTSVGQMASLQVKLTDSQTNLPVTDAVFDIKATASENNWVAFAYQGIPDNQGLLAWQQQFFDGAPHQIEVKVSPKMDGNRQFQPFQVTKNIEVEGIAPPLFVRFVGLFYFTGILSLGLVLGLWLQRQRLQNLA